MSVIAVVGSPSGAFSTTTSVPLPARVFGIGNLVVVNVGMASGAGTGAFTLADTPNANVWNVANPRFNDATNGNTTGSWWAIVTSANSTTISAAATTSGSFMSITMVEFSCDTGWGTNPLDQVAQHAIGGTGIPSTPNVTLSSDPQLVVAYGLDTITAVGNIDGSAATIGGDDSQQDIQEYRILTGRNGVSVNAAFTGSGLYAAQIATFKPPTPSLSVWRQQSRPFPFTPGGLAPRY